MLVLGIESSCDETAAALVEDGRKIRASWIASQALRHRKFKGVVPEIAAREHVKAMLPTVRAALDEAGVLPEDIDVVAATSEPGLVGALLVGAAAAEGLALALGKPVVGVNHIEAHLAAPFLAPDVAAEWPLVSLVASGGHTHFFLSRSPVDHRLLGATIDDAAGEAFDKAAAVLGLGYPGGPAIEAAARDGDPRAFPFKRPTLDPARLDVSFSGLKTALRYRCCGQYENGRPRETLLPDVRVADAAASFQAAVVETLVTKARLAVRQTGVPRFAIGGGVACNGPLRAALAAAGRDDGFAVVLTPPEFCTDNAAMVAAQGFHVARLRGASEGALTVRSRAEWRRADDADRRAE
jgi:N6-L-threonylcarbamoyladenine synthase